MSAKPVNSVFDALRIAIELEAEVLLKEGADSTTVKSALVVGATTLLASLTDHLEVKPSLPIRNYLTLLAMLERDPTANKGYELALPRELTTKPTDN